MPYEKYLQEHLFKPAGMTQTGYLLPDWTREEIAHGYQFTLIDIGTTLEQYQAKGVTWHLVGNGGILSSMSDLNRWDKALNGGLILTQESLSLLYTPHVSIEDNIYSNGYGWRIANTRSGSRVITHSGSNRIFWTDVIMLPDDGVSIFFTTNASHYYDSVTWIGVKIRNMVLSEDYIPSPIEASPFQVSKNYVDNMSPQNLQTYLTKIREKLKEQLSNPGVLNELGFWHLDRGDTEWALSLFKLNTEIHPEDGNIWDSLGEAYVMTKQPKLAIPSFKKALLLGKGKNCGWCENSEKQLEALSMNE